MMNEVDRRSCLACLAAVEENMAELVGTLSWSQMLSAANRREWCEMAAKVREYQHDLNRSSRGDGVVT